MKTEEDLSEAVRVLSGTLHSFDESSESMRGMCGELEDRLVCLEREVLPLKTFSQELGQSRRNLSEAVERIEEVIEYFGVEEEALKVLRRGVVVFEHGGGGDEFVGEMRRVVEAEEYFRGWPSLHSQVEALEGLCKVRREALDVCLREYRRVVISLGDGVEFGGSESGGTFEAWSSFGKRSSLDKLGGLGEAIAVLDFDKFDETVSAAVGAYEGARKEAASLSVKKFEEHFESNPAGREARGTSPWLMLYLAFLKKLCEGEQAIFNEIFENFSENGGRRSSFEKIVWVGVDKLIREVETRLKQEEEEEEDQFPPPKKQLWDVVNNLLEVAELVRSFEKYFLEIVEFPKNTKISELYEKLLFSIKKSCVEAVASMKKKKGVTTFIKLPENASVHVDTSMTLQALRGMIARRQGYEEMARQQTFPWDSDFEGKEMEKSTKFSRLVNHVLATLLETVVDRSEGYLQKEGRRHLFVLNNAHYMLTLCREAGEEEEKEEEEALENFEILKNVEKTFGKNFGKSSSSPKPGTSSSPRRLSLGGLLSPLSPDFGNKKSSPPPSRIFSNKNIAPKTTKNFSSFVSRDFFNTLERLVEECQKDFSESIFKKISAILVDDVGPLDFSRNKLLSQECGRKLKAKFSGFNEAWGELLVSLKGVRVYDSQVKLALKEETRRRVQVPYQEIFEKYHNIPFSKKHQDDYVKYAPSDVRSPIESFFQG